MIAYPCLLCKNPVDIDDPDTWKQVIGLVHGTKAHGMTLREYTGNYAHDGCVKKLKVGQDPSQPDMFAVTPPNFDIPTGFKTKVDGVIEDLFGENDGENATEG